MVLGPQHKIKKITDKIVDQSQSFIGDSKKYLGVIVDMNLRWEEHINNIRAKVVAWVHEIFQ